MKINLQVRSHQTRRWIWVKCPCCRERRAFKSWKAAKQWAVDNEYLEHRCETKI